MQTIVLKSCHRAGGRVVTFKTSALRLYLLLLVIFSGLQVAQAQLRGILRVDGPPTPNPACAGRTLYVPFFEENLQFPPGERIYSVNLLEPYQNSYRVVRLVSSTKTSPLTVIIPESFSTNSNYRAAMSIEVPGSYTISTGAGSPFTITGIPPAPAVTPVSYCQGQQAAPLSATAVAGATLVYYTQASGGVGYTNLTPGTLGSSYTYYVSQRFGDCVEGPRAPLRVTITSRSNAPVIPPGALLEACLQGRFVPPPITGSNLKWYASASGGTGLTPDEFSQLLASTPVERSLTYYVSQTQPDQCESNRLAVRFTLTPPPPITLTSDGQSLNCESNPKTLIRVHPDTYGHATYFFSPGAVQDELDERAAWVTQPGIYSVTAVTGSGCSAEASIEVQGDKTPPTVRLQASGTEITCSSPVVRITASGGSAYRWENNTTDAQREVRSGGVYSVLVTGANGCTATSSLTITEDKTQPLARISATSAALSCHDSIVTLTASGGERYEWEDGSLDAVRLVRVAGFYSVTVTSGACSAIASLEVGGSSQAPTASLENNGPLSASQPVVTLTATAPGAALGQTFSYTFSRGTAPGSTPNMATVSEPGIYSVTVTAPNGCTASAQTTVEAQSGRVTAFELINAVSDQGIRMLGEEEVINLALLTTTKLTIRARTEPEPVGSVVFNLSGTLSYSKTETGAPYALFGDSNGNYDAWTLPLGSYTLTATPYLGASGAGPAGTPLTIRFRLVNQAANQPPIARVGADQALTLPTNSVSLSGSTSSDPEGGPLTYSWSQQSGPSTAVLSGSTAPLLTVSGLTEGIYVFRLTVRDNQGATGFDEMKVHVNAPAAGPRVVSVSLINADSEGEIRVLKNNEELNLATLVTKNLNLRVNTSPQAVGSVRMVLSGAQSRTQTDNGAPYALFGDNQGNFNSWTPKTGSYTLAVTPYGGPNATGPAGAVYTLAFTVVSQTSTGPGVAGFSLIDADNDQELMPLLEGQVINLASLPTKNINIRANTSAATVGSVRMVLSGTQSRTQTDNGVPYALFGDKSGNYNGWTPPVGSYLLTGTTYPGPGATGQAGGSLTINFKVVSQASPARLTTQPTAQEPEGMLMVYPNPFQSSFTLELGKQPQNPVPVVLLDGAGRNVFEQKVAGSKPLIEPGSGLAPGIYILQVGEGVHMQRRKLVKSL